MFSFDDLEEKDRSFLDSLEGLPEGWEQMPAYKKTHERYVRAVEEIYKLRTKKGGQAHFESLEAINRELIGLLAGYLEPETLDEVVSLNNSSLLLMYATYKNHPETRKAMVLLARAQMTSWITIGTAMRNTKIQRQLTTITPIAKLNAAKSELIEKAKSIAAKKWQEDHTKKIRIGKMCDAVYRELAAEGFIEQLPQDADAIREWIASVAPKYARQGGRPRKTSSP
ncbi:MAG: hypothetical protein JKY58_12435 [Pseudomonas sp.]|nr:hypothetical protein [Pseudomonas sp.]